MSQPIPDAVSVAAGRCLLSYDTLGIFFTILFSSKQLKCIAWRSSTGLVVFPILSIVLEICTLKDFISLAALKYFVQRLAIIRVGQNHDHKVSSMPHLEFGARRYF